MAAGHRSADSNNKLITNLKNGGIITSPRVETAMKYVDRANYVRRNSYPYQDSPQPIGYGATISAPHMHGHALELLAEFLKPGARALDVGSGSGYLAACMAHMVGPQGKVIAIEHIPELTELGRENVEKDCPEYLTEGRVEFITGDGREGHDAAAPYDAVHVGAAAYPVPVKLLHQLKAPGRMVIPVGQAGGEQALYQIDKDASGAVSRKELMGVAYVPLTDRDRQTRF